MGDSGPNQGFRGLSGAQIPLFQALSVLFQPLFALFRGKTGENSPKSAILVGPLISATIYYQRVCRILGCFGAGYAPKSYPVLSSLHTACKHSQTHAQPISPMRPLERDLMGLWGVAECVMECAFRGPFWCPQDANPILTQRV